MRIPSVLPWGRGKAVRQRRNRSLKQFATAEVLETRLLLSIDPVTGLYDGHFDFGPAGSQVAAGMTNVNYTNTYSPTSGFGWQSGSISSRDRGAAAGDELVRDFNFTTQGTFAVDVPNGTYELTLIMGDYLSVRDNVAVFLEGAQVDTVTSQAGQYETRTYTVVVSDGQLTLTIDDLDASGNTVAMINGLSVVQLADPPPPPPATPEFDQHFDFGTVDSPVFPGATQINYTDTYSESIGHGWTQGVVDSRDRGTGDDLTGDFNFTQLATFVVDLEPGVYDITLTLGDASFDRDDMGVFIEGSHLDTVSTLAGEFATNTYTAIVADGQLTLTLQGLSDGGSDVMINALGITQVGGDPVGPNVVSTQPFNETTGTFDRITVTFDEAIDENSFGTEDVSLFGPNGEIEVTEVNALSETTFEILFAPQIDLGDYVLTIGPGVTDLAGNAMDQDGDFINGEAGEDEFSTTIALVTAPTFNRLYDFGLPDSPVATGATQVSFNTAYTAESGYGWLDGDIHSRDRGIAHGDELVRDFNFTESGTFAIDVPEGVTTFDVTITMGDGIAARDEMGIFLEGVNVATVSTAAGEYVTHTFRVNVEDGQLTLHLSDFGGDPIAVINALHVVQVDLPPDDDSGNDGGGSTHRISLDQLRQRLRQALRNNPGEFEDFLANIMSDWDSYRPGKSQGKAFGENPNATLSMFLRALKKESKNSGVEFVEFTSGQLDSLFSSNDAVDELFSDAKPGKGGGKK